VRLPAGTGAAPTLCGLRPSTALDYFGEYLRVSGAGKPLACPTSFAADRAGRGSSEVGGVVGSFRPHRRRNPRTSPPPRVRYALTRSIRSFSRQCSSTAAKRYFVGSSEVGVSAHPVGVGLDQGWATAGSRSLQSHRGGLVDRQHVIAIDLYARETEAPKRCDTREFATGARSARRLLTGCSDRRRRSVGCMSWQR
jgi:hypothetical protein